MFGQEGIYIIVVQSGVDVAAKIYRNNSLSVQEKHHAMQEIIDKMPDENLRLKDYTNEHLTTVSLHALLREYINEQKHLELQFFAVEPEVVYLAEFHQLDTGEYTQICEPSLSWPDCVQKIIEYRDFDMDFRHYRAIVTKYWPRRFLDGFMKEATAEFDETGMLMDVSSRMMMTFPCFRNAVFKMEQL